MINQTNAVVTVIYNLPTIEDEYGNTRYTKSEEDYPVLLAWGATGIDFGVERNVLTTQGTLYFQDTINIPQGTEFRINGSMYRLDGEQVRWNAPSGFSLQTGSVIQIKKVEG